VLGPAGRRGSDTAWSWFGSCAFLPGKRFLLLGEDLVGQGLDARRVKREGNGPGLAVMLDLLDEPLHQAGLLARAQGFPDRPELLQGDGYLVLVEASPPQGVYLFLDPDQLLLGSAGAFLQVGPIAHRGAVRLCRVLLSSVGAQLGLPAGQILLQGAPLNLQLG